MFTNMLLVDNEMPSPTPGVPAAVEKTDVGDVDDENGVVAKSLDMIANYIDVAVVKAGLVPPNDEDFEKGNIDPEVPDMVESAVSDVLTETWA